MALLLLQLTTPVVALDNDPRIIITEVYVSPNSADYDGIDWNGDGEINEEDYIIYLQDVYDCDDWIGDNAGCYDDSGNFYNIGSELFLDDAGCTYIWCEGVGNWSDIQIIDDCSDEEGCMEENAWYCIGCEYFIDECIYVECEGSGNWSDWIVIDDCEENEITWTDIDWIVSDWEDFDWESVWDDLDLGNLVDWDNIPWDQIIDLNIFTDEFIDYINFIISGGQPFNWNNFIDTQGGCEDDDTTISMGLSIWTDISGCGEALSYLESQGLDCLSDLNLPFVSADPISLISICCETCQDQINDGCTDPNACNYNPFATYDDGSCDYSCFGCTDLRIAGHLQIIVERISALRLLVPMGRQFIRLVSTKIKYY